MTQSCAETLPESFSNRPSSSFKNYIGYLGSKRREPHIFKVRHEHHCELFLGDCVEQRGDALLRAAVIDCLHAFVLAYLPSQPVRYLAPCCGFLLRPHLCKRLRFY